MKPEARRLGAARVVDMRLETASVGRLERAAADALGRARNGTALVPNRSDCASDSAASAEALADCHTKGASLQPVTVNGFGRESPRRGIPRSATAES
jgi:hypothetical protein